MKACLQSGMGGLFCLLVSGILFCPVIFAAESEPSADRQTFRAERRTAAQRPRRLLYDNDGNEALTQMHSRSAQELLDLRTSGLEKSRVDTIFYGCNAGFGTTSRGSQVWKVHTIQAEPYIHNQTAALLAAGIDPLAVILDFGRRHDIEVFLGVRMNDTHDAAKTGYGVVRFTNNPFKVEHPEFLLGRLQSQRKFGQWSAVDYSYPEVRDSLFRYIEEGMQNYDLDGVHLDFFRHPVFFPSTAQGLPATPGERQQMTELVSRIRQRADEIGHKRGRPLLVSVRVPDSVEYCRDIGLDLEGWLKQDLLDLLVVAGYFQLNEWTTSVQLGHAHGVPVYPSLDESRLKDHQALTARMSVRGYRARAATAWDSGADGVCLFNLFNPRSQLWRELGEIAQLRTLDRDYFGSVRGLGRAAGGNLPHEKYVHAETLSPQHPKNVLVNRPAISRIALGNEFQVNPDDSFRLRLRFQAAPNPEAVNIQLNNEHLEMTRADAEWLECSITPKTLQPGTQIISLKSGAKQATPIKWHDAVLEVRVKSTK